MSTGFAAARAVLEDNSRATAANSDPAEDLRCNEALDDELDSLMNDTDLSAPEAAGGNLLEQLGLNVDDLTEPVRFNAPAGPFALCNCKFDHGKRQYFRPKGEPTGHFAPELSGTVPGTTVRAVLMGHTMIHREGVRTPVELKQ